MSSDISGDLDTTGTRFDRVIDDTTAKETKKKLEGNLSSETERSEIGGK